MAQNSTKYFILTGDPGIGKTSVIKRISSTLYSAGVPLSGFYTEEVRTTRFRDGFDVVSLDGFRGRLARDQSQLSNNVKDRLGKYGILTQEFEDIALPSLRKVADAKTQILVIDEIGRMEFFSKSFETRIKQIFSPKSNYVVLATIPSKKGNAIIESIRNNANTKIWTVTKENRDSLHNDVMKELETKLFFD